MKLKRMKLRRTKKCQFLGQPVGAWQKPTRFRHFAQND